MLHFNLETAQFLLTAFWGYAEIVCYLVFKGGMDGLLGRVPGPLNAQPIFASSPTGPSPRARRSSR